MSKQKYRQGTWVWYKKGGKWHRGRVSDFNSLTSKYDIQPAGNSRAKPVIVSADKLKPNVAEYTPGEKIQFQQPGSKDWQDGIIDRPDSPTEYKVIGGGRSWIIEKSKIRKRH